MGRAGPWLLIGDGAGWAHESSLSSCSSPWPHPAESFIHALIYSLLTQFTHSPSHSSVHWGILSPTHSFPRIFTRASIHSLPDSPIHILTLEELPPLGPDPMLRFLTCLL